MNWHQLLAIVVVIGVVWMCVAILRAREDKIERTLAAILLAVAMLAGIYGLVRFVHWAWYQ